MEIYDDVYYKLFLEMPEEYAEMGSFGTCYWLSQINEGLIHTYDYDVLERNVGDLSDSTATIAFNTYVEEAKRIILTVIPHEGFDKDQTCDRLQKIFNLYGWNVGKIEVTPNGHYIIVVEAKTTDTLSTAEIESAPFYHVTFKRYDNKITKNGLVPRDSYTTFAHPGGRVYIVQVLDRSTTILQHLKKVLSHSRREAAAQETDTTEIARIMRRIEYTGEDIEDNMVIYRVSVPPDVEVYRDPMYEMGSKFRSCYVTKNIPPEYVKQVN